MANPSTSLATTSQDLGHVSTVDFAAVVVGVVLAGAGIALFLVCLHVIWKAKVRGFADESMGSQVGTSDDLFRMQSTLSTDLSERHYHDTGELYDTPKIIVGPIVQPRKSDRSRLRFNMRQQVSSIPRIDRPVMVPGERPYANFGIYFKPGYRRVHHHRVDRIAYRKSERGKSMPGLEKLPDLKQVETSEKIGIFSIARVWGKFRQGTVKRAAAREASRSTLVNERELGVGREETPEFIETPVEQPKPPKETVQPPKETVQPPKETVQPPKETVQPTKETVQPTKETVQPTKETVQPTKETVQLQSIPEQDVVQARSASSAPDTLSQFDLIAELPEIAHTEPEETNSQSAIEKKPRIKKKLKKRRRSTF